jgi:hypothetical protein
MAKLLPAAAVAPTEAPSGCCGNVRYICMHHSAVHKVRSAAPHAVSNTSTQANPSSQSQHMMDERTDVKQRDMIYRSKDLHRSCIMQFADFY